MTEAAVTGASTAPGIDSVPMADHLQLAANYNKALRIIGALQTRIGAAAVDLANVEADRDSALARIAGLEAQLAAAAANRPGSPA